MKGEIIMGAIIGLRDLHYARLLTDGVGGATYATPVRIPGVIQANINPNPSIEALFADDGPMDVASTLGQIEVELVAREFPMQIQADLLGHSIVGANLRRNANDVPPWVAIGFRSLKSNGVFRFIWLFKGRFQVPEMSHETRGDSISFQTPTLNGVFVRRDWDSQWMRQTDEDFIDYVPSIGTNWFLAVDGAADTVAPTVTVVPAPGATAVARGANIVWTFNEPIAFNTVRSANFMLLRGGVEIPGTLTVDPTRTIVTLDPTPALLDATQLHTAICTTDVTDVAGNRLVANSITTFTTAA